MQNRVGQQFGNYRLLRLLGKGGFAEVYLGEHIYMQSKAAVKVLYGPLITSDAQSFLQEARTLASLEHPNIVGIKEFDIKHDIPFLVMNYAPNGTLRQRHAKGQPVPLGTVVSYVLQVASALQYAHDRHIVHRDLKPENMLIDNNGNILLSDFGIAVLSSSTHSSGSKGPAGTYFYMAPEQITGKAFPASDQYALGITVYEWLCGEVPFVGSITEITAQHIHVPPPPFRDRRIVIEPQVEAVIRRALEKDPQQRFASVREFALALQSSSKPQQHSSAYIPSASSKDSIFLSPSDKTSGFTRNPTQSPPPVQPRPTPHITRQVEPPTPDVPSPQQAPTIYPYNTVQYAPTQPAPQYPQPRKTGHPCLVATLISVALLLVIGIGSAFAIPKILPWLISSPAATATTGFGGGSPTSVPTTGTNSPVVTNTPEQLIDDFCQNLMMKNYSTAYDKYSKNLQDQVTFTDFVNYWSANNKQFYEIDRCDHQTISTPSGNSITASWSTHEFYSSQVQNYRVTFIVQGNEWKIDQIVSS